MVVTWAWRPQGPLLAAVGREPDLEELGPLGGVGSSNSSRQLVRVETVSWVVRGAGSLALALLLPPDVSGSRTPKWIWRDLKAFCLGMGTGPPQPLWTSGPSGPALTPSPFPPGLGSLPGTHPPRASPCLDAVQQSWGAEMRTPLTSASASLSPRRAPAGQERGAVNSPGRTAMARLLSSCPRANELSLSSWRAEW